MAERSVAQPIKKIVTKPSRILPFDVLRGLIIVLMALDHANLFIAHKHSPGEYWGGGFPVYYDALAFLTRFVTHLCPSGFFFLMGAGMILFSGSRIKSGWSRWDITKHFLIRGILLIALQFLIVNRAWELSPGGWEVDTYFGVLSALGGTMILGSLLLWFKPRYLLGLTVVLLIGTELFIPDPSLWGPSDNLLKLVMLVSGGLGGGKGVEFWSNYPVLAWLELVTFGMAFGYWIAENPKETFKRAFLLGIALLAGFVIIRYLDGFGNIRARMGNGWIDFLNPVKYPPSISYSLLTMGINLIILALFGHASDKVQEFFQPLAVFGRVPLFFYVIHLFLYARLGLWMTPDGTSILSMYPYWLLGILILFPFCLWYGSFKHRQPSYSILRFL